MNRPAVLVRWLAATLLLLSASSLIPMAAEAPATPAPVVKAEETNSLETMRAYLQLQEQLHQAQLSIEQTRKEAREAAVDAAEALAAQMKIIEAALASQRARELEAMQSSNRVMLIMAGIFAALGFLAMVLMAYFQWRTVHGLAEISAVLPAARSLSSGRVMGALGPGEFQPVSAVAEESSARLLGALEQLEKRIHGLEQAGRPVLVAGDGGQTASHNGNGDADPQQAGAAAAGDERGQAAHPDTSAAMSDEGRARGLLTAGQALLELDDPGSALAHFEQALTLAPGHAEALVKKGSALERLGRLNEAVECYDQAIAADNSLTVAYLHKGGLFNRMERFPEALDCYEKALRTQEKQQR